MKFRARKRVKRGVYLVIIEDGNEFKVCKETPGRNFYILRRYDNLQSAFKAYTEFLTDQTHLMKV